MAKQLYEGKINEFTDWITGVDSTTGNKVTELEISGGSIRNLLQDRLVKPFYGHYDKERGLCLLFSSKTAYNIWRDTDDEDLKASLLLFSFNAPSDYEFEFTQQPSGQYYMRAGDTSSSYAIISFKWRLLKGLAEFVDGVIITYTITNGSKSKTFSKIYLGSSGLNTILESVYDYLTEGRNDILINIKSLNTSAAATISYSVTVVSLRIASNFTFYKNVINVNNTSSNADKNISFITSVYRNNPDSDTVVYVSIDNSTEDNKQKQLVVTDQFNASTVLVAFSETDLFRGNNPLSYGTHTLQIYAVQEFGSNIIKSNLLYYTFTVTDQQSADKTILPNGIKTINYGISVPSFTATYDSDAFTLKLVLYEKAEILWGYYISELKDLTISVDWMFECIKQDDSITYINVSTLSATTRVLAENLVFIPSINSTNYKLVYLVAKHGNYELTKIKVIIQKSPYIILESTGYDFKLSAYGRVNNSTTVDVWENNDVSTYFHNIDWNNTNGWYKNSFRTRGVDSYALIDYNVFESHKGLPRNVGFAVEIDFETENVMNTDDTLILVGNNSPGCLYIKITPNSASYYTTAHNELIKTNYKANERVKICFVLYYDGFVDHTGGTYFSNKVAIITDGVLERCASFADFPREVGEVLSNATINVGTIESPNYKLYGIKIGGANSGVRVYSIRCYPNSIKFLDAYNNYVFDSENKSEIITSNDVTSGTQISLDKCLTKLDTIILSSPSHAPKTIDELLDEPTTTKDDSLLYCNIERVCPGDASKNFKIENGQLRKHGLSTLNYAVPSFKIWSNTNPGYYYPTDALGNRISDKKVPGVTGAPKLTCSQSDLGLNKNRYKMKDTSIPCNKWVLLANYADSSGVHNGGLQRLIEDTWYKAVVYDLYVLQTPPQLFANNLTYVRRDNGVDGYSNVKSNGVLLYPNKQWKDLNVNDRGINNPNSKFPYEIRISPDSFPCVVFYEKNVSETEKTNLFLGLYVFMDDKKSDTLYGERSIYKFEKDPFCLTVAHSKDDDKVNMVWDNDDVLRIEVLNINTLFTSYISTINHNGAHLTDWVKKYNEKGELVRESYAWLEDFELIYPDPDDLTYNSVHSYVDPPKKTIERKTKPFIEWLEWLTSTYDATVANAIRTNTMTNELINHEPFNTFIRTADLHLDVYKLAAYYVFVLRFGLVDSLERNVQIKTYDGQHFWYEPWDMDIALGNKNDGGIAFDPPITRDTKLDDITWALSGRSILHSNWLFDALEAWPEWRTQILPDVASALYKAGLTYENATKMFDENYASAWNETMYNYSGFFKYIQQGGGSRDMLAWLQGARKTHRHWWLKTSFDYYDALWTVGDFSNSQVFFLGNHSAGDPGSIYITSNVSTYFNIERDGGKLGAKKAEADIPVEYDFTDLAVTTKNPIRILGAHFIKDLDVSLFARSLFNLNVSGAYSKEAGPCIISLNMGCGLQAGHDYQRNVSSNNLIKGAVSGNLYSSYVNTAGFNPLRTLPSGEDALAILETFNIRGALRASGVSIPSTLHTFYAMGSGLTSFSSSTDGNRFNILELPSTVSILSLNDSSFNELTFWDTEIDDTGLVEVILDDPDDASTIREVPIKIGKYTKYTIPNLDVVYYIPPTLNTLSLLGTTGRQNCSKLLVLDWIKCIDALVAAANTIEEQQALGFSNKTLEADSIYWEGITYEELSKIAQMKNHKALKGYICLEGSPSANQIAQLMLWFGSTIFIKGSDLNIDYSTEVTVITFDADDSEKSGSGSVNNEVYKALDSNRLEVYSPLMYIKEGYAGREVTGFRGVYINATLFRLRPSNSADLVWGLYDTETNVSYVHRYKSLRIDEIKTGTDDQGRDIYERYLVAEPSTYEDYYVTLRVGSLNNSNYLLVVVKVITVKYPDNYHITLTQGCQYARSFGNFVSMYRDTSSIEFFALSVNEIPFIPNTINNNPATVSSIIYKIKDIDNGNTYLELDDLGNKLINPYLLDNYTKLVKNGMFVSNTGKSSYATDIYTLRLFLSKGVILSTTIPERYEISAVITIGAKQMNCAITAMLIAEDQNEALLTSLSQMYKPVASAFYRTHQLELTGAIYISDAYVITKEIRTNDANDTNQENPQNIITNNVDDTLAYRPIGESIFKYFINLEGLDLSGSTLLTTTKTVTVSDGVLETFNQIVFPLNNKLTSLKTNNCTVLGNLDYLYLTSLVTLELQNCPAVTSIDLTNNTNLLDINLSGCTGLTALVITPCTKLRTLDVTGTIALSSITLPTSSLFESVKFGNPSIINIPPVPLFTGDSGITNNEWNKPVTDTTKSKISFTSVSNLSSVTLNAGENGIGAISTLCRILDAKYNNGGA